MQDGSTALHLASTRGFVDTVRTLLDVGAHVNAADKVRRNWRRGMRVWCSMA